MLLSSSSLLIVSLYLFICGYILDTLYLASIYYLGIVLMNHLCSGVDACKSFFLSVFFFLDSLSQGVCFLSLDLFSHPTILFGYGRTFTQLDDVCSFCFRWRSDRYGHFLTSIFISFFGLFLWVFSWSPCEVMGPCHLTVPVSQRCLLAPRSLSFPQFVWKLRPEIVLICLQTLHILFAVVCVCGVDVVDIICQYMFLFVCVLCACFLFCFCFFFWILLILNHSSFSSSSSSSSSFFLFFFLNHQVSIVLFSSIFPYSFITSDLHVIEFFFPFVFCFCMKSRFSQAFCLPMFARLLIELILIIMTEFAMFDLSLSGSWDSFAIVIVTLKLRERETQLLQYRSIWVSCCGLRSTSILLLLLFVWIHALYSIDLLGGLWKSALILGIRHQVSVYLTGH